MNDVFTVAQSTFGRFARLKSLYLILVICLIDVSLMGSYGTLTMGMEKELMIDCALAIATVVSLLTAMTAAFDIPRELREKTALFILTKPMGRSSFIWGKFLGIGGLAAFNVLFVTLGSAIVVNIAFNVFPVGLIQQGILLVGEALILTGVGLALSVVLPDVLAVLGVFVAFFIGHSVFMLPRVSPGRLSTWLAAILPNFHNLDVKDLLGNTGESMSGSYVQWGAGYAICYAVLLVGLATVLFSRKDIS